MKVILEKKKCIGCGSCAALDPVHFKMVGDKAELVKPDKVKDEIYEKEVSEVDNNLQDGTDSCPVICIEIKKD